MTNIYRIITDNNIDDTGPKVVAKRGDLFSATSVYLDTESERQDTHVYLQEREHLVLANQQNRGWVTIRSSKIDRA